MKRARILYAMVRADFLERVRRYGFLLTLGFAVYLGYAVYSGQVTLRLADYRGVNNSAWIGSVVGLVATVWLSLIGFYVVKNAIQRDRETRVGQILATTPMSKGFYTLAKAISNFAVLAVMVLILAVAAVVIQVTNGGSLDLFALMGPILIFGLTALAVTAAIAVLFESLPVLRGGVGNIAYFFLWIFLLVMSANKLDHGPFREPAAGAMPNLTDLTGIGTVMGQMQAQVRLLDPVYQGGSSFGLGNITPTTKFFVWRGLEWTAGILLGRIFWLGVAVGIALLASLFFDRFDPASGFWLKAKKSGAEAAEDRGNAGSDPVEAQGSAVQLTPLVRRAWQSRFAALVMAEFRLMARGQAWWWYLVAAGLVIASLASPLAAARSGVIAAAWIWPTLIWSQMGTREAQFSTRSLIFSAPKIFPRQLLAVWSAGVLVAVTIGSGLGLHLLIAGDWQGLGAWLAGAMFIPALAMALGVLTESRKPFEAIYTIWWYVGPLHHLRGMDFMGTTAESSTAMGYLVAGLALVAVASLWRKVRLAAA